MDGVPRQTIACPIMWSLDQFVPKLVGTILESLSMYCERFMIDCYKLEHQRC